MNHKKKLCAKKSDWLLTRVYKRIPCPSHGPQTKHHPAMSSDREAARCTSPTETFPIRCVGKRGYQECIMAPRRELSIFRPRLDAKAIMVSNCEKTAVSDIHQTESLPNNETQKGIQQNSPRYLLRTSYV